MKILLNIFLSLFLLFNISSNFSPAFVYSSSVDDITAGVGCGLMNNQCCGYIDSSNLDIPRLPIPILGWVIDQLVKPIEWILNEAVSPIIDGTEKLIIGGIIGVDQNSDESKCIEGEPLITGNSCTCIKEDTGNLSYLCTNIGNESEKNRCLTCIGQENCYWSGIGSIYTDLPSFINKNLFGIFLSLAGVLTLLCIIYSAFILQTSSGNPERIKKARQYLTSCIAGLLVIIFSIFILRIVGGTIIRIPGFN